MRILLLIPTHKYNPNSSVTEFLSASDFPTGLAYLAGALKTAGHEVLGCNPNNVTTYPTGYKMLEAKIKESLQCRPDLIGLGGICTDYAFIRDAIEIIRREAPLTPIVLGGGIVTYDAEFIFNHLKPDFCIIGEAEETIVELADMLQSGKKDFDQINNIGYWRVE